ncbi:MAG: non-hydrolyzing UDP-N-acetylglucosamine 2-epimerase [Bacteroidia bacterium]
MKILTIVGARPQFIKAAAVSRAFSKHKEIVEIIVHTGQHFDKNMSDVFFEEMQIPKPHYNLNIHGLSHGAMTGQMLEGIEKIILKENPDYVLVYGDTNSTIAGALAAKKLHVKVIHVEAGLRSFNMEMPEEINRIVTDRISDILFCPTDAAVENLKKEGMDKMQVSIIKNGDVMQDAALFYAEQAEKKSTIIKDLSLNDFVLCTIHRAENTDNVENLKNIIKGLNKINSEIQVLVPLHPRTKNILEKENIPIDFKLIEPVGYFDMIMLLKHCKLVITDSGGLQKEAFFFQKNCVTLRNETEWVELVENGYNELAGNNSDKIYQAYQKMIVKKNDFSKNLYGNGKACDIIVDKILSHNIPVN